MKKNKKKACLILAISMLSSSNVFASSINQKSEYISVSVSQDISNDSIESRLSYDNKSYLSTNGWSNITNDNNWLNAKLDVTNKSSNDGSIKIRVINEDGKIIVASTTVNLGSTITLEKIGAFSGEYYVQGKAVLTDGNYDLKIVD